jgi:hypothetical protein
MGYLPYIPYFFAGAFLVIIAIAVLGIVLIRKGRRSKDDPPETRGDADEEAPTETVLSKPADGSPLHAEKDADESRQE